MPGAHVRGMALRRPFGVSLLVTLGVALSTACATGRFGPKPPGVTKSAPRKLDQVTVEERRAILKRAQVWTPIATETLDLAAGPQGRGAIEEGGTVNCEFVYPDAPLSGLSPKFHCRLPSDDVVKIKYGEKNGEIYAVVAASRLLWALGFATDRWYPVSVRCAECPEDPWRVSQLEWYKGRPRFVASRTFNVATLEREIAGEKVETPGFEGWAWPELEQVDSKAGGATRAQIDALKLIAVFLQHGDTKPPQQKLICPPDQIRRDQAGNETCGAARLVLQDVGATFSEGSFFTVGKVDLDKWRNSPIWKDGGKAGEACVGHVTPFLNASLKDPVISEAGRQFLADRLSLLTDAQLRVLFTVARFDRRYGAGNPRSGSIDEWVRVFKAKRAEIVNHHCPA